MAREGGRKLVAHNPPLFRISPGLLFVGALNAFVRTLPMSKSCTQPVHVKPIVRLIFVLLLHHFRVGKNTIADPE